jgi:hypothetical protein
VREQMRVCDSFSARLVCRRRACGRRDVADLEKKSALFRFIF